MKKTVLRDKGIMKFRGLQLDIGNQPENLDCIRSFIDLADKYGYNYLALHLKGRIRTKSFPYRNPGESYTPDDMKRIVDYAGKKKIDVLPIVETFGHVEQFLDCPELEHLAELRGGREGRFSKFKHVFCPSLKKTHEFLENYLTEVAKLFPSEYFHAGFDEAWDIGYCDLCKKRLETETQADIFRKHLLDVHGIVARKMKKRMIIWDDLFDIYPQALGKLPRDIIMCPWHYDKLIERPFGHCGGPQTDKLALYDKLGFKYIFAPATYCSIRNVETFSSYALSRKPLGALLTIWGGLRRSDYPIIAYAGMAWSGNMNLMPAATIQDKAVQETTGCDKKELIGIIKTILNAREITMLPNKGQAYLRGPLSNEEYGRKSFVEAAGAALEPYFKNPSQRLQGAVLEDLAVCVEVESIYFEMRELISALYSLTNSPRQWAGLKKRIGRCLGRLKAVKAKRRQQWDRHRKGITPCRTDAYFDSLIKMLLQAPQEAKKTKALLKVTFPQDASNVEFFVRYQDDGAWQKVASGAASHSRCYFPLYTDKIPKVVRIEAWGYVGLGISFLEIDTGKNRYVPAAIGAMEGRIINPAALLEEGRPGNGDYCFMGEGELSARRKFNNPFLAKARNAMEINLKKEV